MDFGWLNKRGFKKSKALVLVYHRIADCTIDPWQLCVSPHIFEQHIQLLKEKYHVISVETLAKQLANKNVKDKTVCITFDDGYADNYNVAKAILTQYHCPAAFFIASHYVNQQQHFWWDELQSLILTTQVLPSVFEINIDNIAIKFNLDNERLLSDDLIEKHKAWKYTDVTPTKRCMLYEEMWKILKPLPFESIEKIMGEVRRICNVNGFNRLDNDTLTMTWQQIKELDTHPLFSIGIHTATHPALACHPITMQRNEIVACKTALEDLLQHPVTTIAYPYGNYNKETLAVAKELNLTAAFTTEEKPIDNASNPLGLGRVTVENWDAENFERKLDLFFKTKKTGKRVLKKLIQSIGI